MEKCALTADFFLAMTGFYTMGVVVGGLFRLIICYYGMVSGGGWSGRWWAWFTCAV